jgi:hypothetical protein
MKLAGLMTAALVSLTLVAVAPAFAQEQHDQDEQKAKPAQEEKKAQPEKSAKPEANNARQDDKSGKPEQNARQDAKGGKPAENNVQQHQSAGNKGGGRIPDDRFKANFGREHSFRVSENDYRNHRFQYGGYWFGFEQAWPSNWLYTQNVYVIEIDGVYYLCNSSFPGVNLALSFTM